MAQEDQSVLMHFVSLGKVPFRRWKAGYFTCLACGEEQARAVKHCIVPMHKSNYVVVSDRNLLTGVNQKGGFTWRELFVAIVVGATGLFIFWFLIVAVFVLFG
jgi:hypothetical protein